MKSSEKSKKNCEEGPIMFAMEQDNQGLIHIVTDIYGYQLFVEFLDLYATNIPEDLISQQEH